MPALLSSPTKWIGQGCSPLGDINVGGLKTLGGLSKRQLFTVWLVTGVEACGDTSLVFFLQKVVLPGAPASVTFTPDLVSGYGCQHACPEGLMKVRSPAAVGR